MLQPNIQKLFEKLHMSKHQSVSAVHKAKPQLDWYWTFFHFLFVTLLQGTLKKRMTISTITLTPTTKEPKICHALATTSALNHKLCSMFHQNNSYFFYYFCWSFFIKKKFHIWRSRISGKRLILKTQFKKK